VSVDGHRRIIGPIIAVLVVILLAVVIVGLLWNWPNGSYAMNTNGFPYWLFGLFIVFIFFGIIVRLIFWAIFGPPYRRRYWSYDWSGPHGAAAEDILDQRYARGEITREQYVQMKDDLNRNRRKVE
jgi:putative membrane protein